MADIDFNSIEKKWVERWDNAKLGEAVRDSKKPKFFIIFAYPGISGYLHIGHMRGYSYTDAIARYKRMRGFNVLFPVGTHASGNQAIALAKKLEKKDKDWVEYLLDNNCPKEKLKELVEPENIVEYFNDVYVNQWKSLGFLADWNRFTCTIYQDYNKFIQWQFEKLKQNNLLIQKPYYGTFCPECGPVAVDPSETDISKGGNAEKLEFILLKFKFEDSFILAATLRPETVFGQTNLWVNPKAKYVKIKVNDELWIISRESMNKLKFQKENTEFIEDIYPETLIGKYAVAPGINREIIILPSTFADPGIGTGIVTSVPSDAPYDWIALHDLQENKEECEKYALSFEEIKKIKPISIIDSKGYGELPAIEICSKLGIKSQKDTALLEEATQEVYKIGFHTGIMKEIAGKYSSMPVERAKELVKQDLIAANLADVLYDLSEEVICRCNTRVIIKKIDDQWFIKYSDNELKEKSKEHAALMNIYPGDYKKNLPAVLDWFQDRACARLGNWFGTKLPFDNRWTIEPISDSTLYPAYYIVSKYVNEDLIKPEQLTEEFFDYVFLGLGSSESIAKKLEINEAILTEIRDDFEYWYPLDLNLGGKEHQTVHFPVFLMNHVAVLDKKYWPSGIFVNYWVTGKGSKISKSKGGAEPVPNAIEKYGVDGMRLYYAHIGSAHSDVIWDEDVLANYKASIERIYNIVSEALEITANKKSAIDSWLISELNKSIKTAAQALDALDIRTASTLIYYKMYDNLKWYIRRHGEDEKTIRFYLDQWSKLLAPVTPFIAEEIWEKVGDNSLVSCSSWPAFEQAKIKPEYGYQENLIQQIMEDIRAIKELVKLDKVTSVELIVAESWKYDFYQKLKEQTARTRVTADILKAVMQTELKKYGGEITRLIPKLIDKLPELVLDQESEFKILTEAQKFLETEFSCITRITKAEELAQPQARSAQRSEQDHSKGEPNREAKAEQALPGKPAIILK